MNINLTKEEARTLLWALQIVNAQETKRLLKKGVDLDDQMIVKNLGSISRNVNAELVKSKD